MTPVRQGLGMLAALVLLFGLAGCEDDPKAPEARAVLMDRSGSFIDSVYGQSWQQVVREDVAAMAGPGPVTLRGFSGEVGAENCKVPTEILSYASNNSQTFEDDKGPLAARLIAHAEPYFACLEERVNRKSSDILGALGQVMSTDLRERSDPPPFASRRLTLLSDGCQSSAELRLCSAKRLDDAKWRTAAIRGLPASAKPDMKGVQVCFIGLGAGSKLEQRKVSALRSFYDEYFATVGATVKFTQGTTCQK